MNPAKPNRSFLPLGRIAAVLAVVLFSIFGPGCTVASYVKSDGADANQQSYNNSFEDVFLAVMEAVEREGWFVDDAQKETGTCVFTRRGWCGSVNKLVIRPVDSPNGPKTLVTFEYITPPKGLDCLADRKAVPTQVFRAIQVVLATYR